MIKVKPGMVDKVLKILHKKRKPKNEIMITGKIKLPRSEKFANSKNY